MVFGKATDAKHAEAQDTPLFIDTLHDGIMRSRPHEARSLSKLDFQVIGFRIKPDFYFFGHRRSPGFSWSVR
jgi:hypothetical protein